MDPAATFTLSLPATAGSLGCVRHVLAGLDGLWPMSRAALDDLQIATVEACTNVVQHAYRDRATGLMEIEAELQGGVPVIVVRDQGGGFAPRTDSPGLGVGLSLISALTDELRISRLPDGTHEVRMRFEAHSG